MVAVSGHAHTRTLIADGYRDEGREHCREDFHAQIKTGTPNPRRNRRPGFLVKGEGCPFPRLHRTSAQVTSGCDCVAVSLPEANIKMRFSSAWIARTISTVPP